jgi:hypothetical protein
MDVTRFLISKNGIKKLRWNQGNYWVLQKNRLQGISFICSIYHNLSYEYVFFIYIYNIYILFVTL